MPWPLVARGRYEEAVKTIRQLEDRMVEWRSLAEASRTLYADLIAKYHELAKEARIDPHLVAGGASISLPQPPKAEPSYVATIIRDQSRNDPRLAAYLKTYATQLKADGATEEDIGMALTQWTTTEPLSQ